MIIKIYYLIFFYLLYWVKNIFMIQIFFENQAKNWIIQKFIFWSNVDEGLSNMRLLLFRPFSNSERQIFWEIWKIFKFRFSLQIQIHSKISKLRKRTVITQSSKPDQNSSYADFNINRSITVMTCCMTGPFLVSYLLYMIN